MRCQPFPCEVLASAICSGVILRVFCTLKRHNGPSDQVEGCKITDDDMKLAKKMVAAHRADGDKFVLELINPYPPAQYYTPSTMTES